MKIMICGSSGQLGRDCVQVLERPHEVFALSSGELDITNISNVYQATRACFPDIILNCAAFTNVDGCETERELAWAVNVEGPKNLAEAVKRYGGLLIHISSDYIFDGLKDVSEPYIEEDEPNPLSYYGKTKLEGEMAIMRVTNRYAILRTAWLYGLHGRNFLKTILKMVLKNPDKEMKIVNDQFGSPTWSYQLAMQIAKIIEKKGHGVYHVTAEGYCTWYELASYFLNKIGVPHLIVPCTSEEYSTAAKRPKNSILENRKLKKEGINLMKKWFNDVDQFICNYREQLLSEALNTKK